MGDAQPACGPAGHGHFHAMPLAVIEGQGRRPVVASQGQARAVVESRPPEKRTAQLVMFQSPAMMIDERLEVCKASFPPSSRLTGPDAVVYLGLRTMDKHPVERGIEGVLKTYELLDRVRTRQDLTIRDDQFEFAVFLDAAVYARRRRIPMTVLDTGRFPAGELESLARKGVRICTSDEARPRPEELELLVRACRASRSSLAFLLEAELPAGAGPRRCPRAPWRTSSCPAWTSTFPTVLGSAIPASSRPWRRRAGRGRRSSSIIITGLSRRSSSVRPRAGPGSISRTAASRTKRRPGWPVPSPGRRRPRDRGPSWRSSARWRLTFWKALWDAGAALRFLTPPGEAGSALGAIERKAGRRKIPPRAVYLSDILFP
jgi:hypothetical protein